MTTSEVATVLDQLALVPKRFYVTFEEPQIDTAGRACVQVRTIATSVTIRHWFELAGMTVTRMERKAINDYWLVYFDWV